MKSHRNQLLAILAGGLGAAAFLAAGCEIIAPVDWSRANQDGIGGAGAGGAAGGTTTSTGGTGGGTGGAGGTSCMQPADCPPSASECVMATCLDNTCGTMNVPQGMPTPTQVQGDCKLTQCTGAGEVESIDDDTDAADDMKECTTDTCVGGTTTHTNVNPGTACTENGGSVCNNAGACVECITDANCMVAGETCQNGNCNPPGCANAMKDGSETDIDCGGTECNPCGTNQICLMASDCISTVCTGGQCQAATCTDTVKNSDETDVDCGGSCPGCALGMSCGAASDCLSGVCQGGVCSIQLINGCDGAMAMDLTGMPSATVTTMGLNYNPKCLKVSTGTAVTWNSNFMLHPLVGGTIVGGSMKQPDPSSPIKATTSGVSVTFAFPNAGVYGFYCDVHGTLGMNGAIFVE